MKSKEEIEERIGFELEYREYEIHINGNDYNNFQDKIERHRTLEQKSENAVRNLLIESLENGDIETVNVCENILKEAGTVLDSNFVVKRKTADSDFKEKREELQSQFLEKYISELQSIDIESVDKSKVEEILKNYQIVSKWWKRTKFCR